jgi:hypothetical protein
MGKLALAFAGTALVLAAPAQATPSVTLALQPDDQVAELVAAVESVVSQYPTAPFVITSGYDLTDGTYAASKPGSLEVNRIYSTNPEKLEENFDYDVQHGYHSPGCSAQTYTGIHEAAHQIDYTHSRRARTAALLWSETTTSSPSDLSGYSFDPFGSFSPAEALAEAFVAVKCDPAGSTKAEYELYNILINTQ